MKALILCVLLSGCASMDSNTRVLIDIALDQLAAQRGMK